MRGRGRGGFDPQLVGGEGVVAVLSPVRGLIRFASIKQSRITTDESLAGWLAGWYPCGWAVQSIHPAIDYQSYRSTIHSRAERSPPTSSTKKITAPVLTLFNTTIIIFHLFNNYSYVR